MFPIVTSAYFTCHTIQPIEEAANNAKHMQLVSGVSVRTYWAAYFIVDFALGLVLSAVCLIMSSVGEQKIWDADGAAAAAVLLACFFAAFLMQIYLGARFFKVPANGVRMVLFGNVFLGEIPLIAAVILRASQNVDIANQLIGAFSWLPIFCLSQGFVMIGDNYANLQTAQKLLDSPGAAYLCNGDLQGCCDFLEKSRADSGPFCNTNYFTTQGYPGAGGMIIACILQAVVLGALLIMFEEKHVARFHSRYLKKKPEKLDNDVDIDEDVLSEKNRVQNAGGNASDLITIDQVYKYFTKPEKISAESASKGSCSRLAASAPVKRAVDGVSVGVAPRECFGLLGVNGAGKTTLFKMLTGDHTLDDGEIKVAGYDVATQLQQVQRSIGYVPQFDALLGYMTGRELLSFYAALKGLPAAVIPQTVDHLIHKLYLGKHADKPSKTYSGGNKRKLSVATALVGAPQIILLDEPTTGMDPGSRRFLWNVILGLVDEGCSLVLTTHSMEECEALCTRLTIMVSGKFRCLGSPQHLKDRFGSGYSWLGLDFDRISRSYHAAPHAPCTVLPLMTRSFAC